MLQIQEIISLVLIDARDSVQNPVGAGTKLRFDTICYSPRPRPQTHRKKKVFAYSTYFLSVPALTPLVSYRGGTPISSSILYRYIQCPPCPPLLSIIFSILKYCFIIPPYKETPRIGGQGGHLLQDTNIITKKLSLPLGHFFTQKSTKCKIVVQKMQICKLENDKMQNCGLRKCKFANQKMTKCKIAFYESVNLQIRK